MNTQTIDRPTTKRAVVPNGATSKQPAIASSLMDIIARAAADPTFDIDRLEQLLALKERETLREAEQAFNGAMSAVQSELRPIAYDSNNPQTRSRYSSYAALDRAIRPIYTAHGFALMFGTEPDAPLEHVRVYVDVTHGPVTRRTRVDMPADGKGARGGDVMSKTHAAASAISYGRRYLLGMVFNLATSADGDDDGNRANDTGDRLTGEQVADLRAKIEKAGATEEGFCKWARVEHIEQIAGRHYQRCLQGIAAYAAKHGSK